LNFNTGIILQARTGSVRLPKKMVLPFFNGKPILQVMLERILKTVPDHIKPFLATSVNQDDNEIEDLATKSGISLFRGSEENVLHRFIEAAHKFNLNRIIRICGDNPFFDMEGTLQLLQFDPLGEYDYVSYKVRGDKPSILSHLGFWGEVVLTAALEKTKFHTNEKIYQEHVTNYIYQHPDNFKIKLIEAPSGLGHRDDIRLTVDTQEDFELSREIFSELIKQDLPLNPIEIVSFIDRHPEYRLKMKEQIELNKK